MHEWDEIKRGGIMQNIRGNIMPAGSIRVLNCLLQELEEATSLETV